MGKKIINYIAATAIGLFVLFFLWMLSTPETESSSSGISCLCFPLFGFALFGCIWLLIQALNRGKQKKLARSPQKTAATTPPSTITSRQATQTGDRFVEVSSGSQTSTPRVTLTYSFETNATRFIKDAQKYHAVEGKPAASVDFMQYWPTFQSLDEKQKKWYFYWRSEVRQGRYPQTSLSYIFIYIYELLCLVENPDPATAATQIKVIWKAYRPAYPELDRYLPDWGGDLVAAKVGLAQGIAWWWVLMTREGIHPPIAVINAIIQRAADAGKVAELPYLIWAGLNLYHPKNKFYQRYNQDGMIDKGYEKAIRAIDAYLLSQKAKKGLLERYAPPRFHSQTKPAFTSAIVPEDYPRRIDYGEARNYAGTSRLGNLLVSITKYAENILRKQHRFSARLSGFVLEEKFKRVLDEAFATPPEKKAEEPVRITLDTQRIATLQKESEQVIALLEPEPAEESKPLYSDIVQVSALWEKLDVPARRLLLGLYHHQIETVDQISAEFLGASTPPHWMINRVNSLSLPLLGDRIISIQDRNQIKLADDFFDEMELIAGETPLESLTVSSNEQATVEEEDPWQRFLHQLSAEEAELLSRLVSAGSLTEAQIDDFARAHTLMGNALIDSLNEKAIEQLDHTPFYPDVDSWFVEEEDWDVLREILDVQGA